MTNQNLKISLYVLSAFLISFSIVFSIFYLYDSGNLFYNSTSIIKKQFDNTSDSIFILGVSYVGQLDVKHIKNYLKHNGFDMDVFHPQNSDPHLTFSNYLDDLVYANPKLVIIGLGFSDFGYFQNDMSERKCPSFNGEIPAYEKKPTPYLNNFSDNVSDHDYYFDPFQINPKQMVVEILRFYFESNDEILVLSKDKTIPLQRYTEDGINDIDSLNKFEPHTYGMCYDVRDLSLNSLSSTIDVLQKNNIQVILFITPFTQIYLDKMPDQLEYHLKDEYVKIANEFDVPFYDYSYRYSNENIFADHVHVARNPESSIYSEDIANIIIKNLNP